MANPERAYTLPEEVVNDAALTREQKRRILESWAHDQGELAQAEAENMSLKHASKLPPEEMLRRIKDAQTTLKGDDTCHPSPLKN